MAEGEHLKSNILRHRSGPSVQACREFGAVFAPAFIVFWTFSGLIQTSAIEGDQMRAIACTLNGRGSNQKPCSNPHHCAAASAMAPTPDKLLHYGK